MRVRDEPPPSGPVVDVSSSESPRQNRTTRACTDRPSRVKLTVPWATSCSAMRRRSPACRRSTSSRSASKRRIATSASTSAATSMARISSSVACLPPSGSPGPKKAARWCTGPHGCGCTRSQYAPAGSISQSRARGSSTHGIVVPPRLTRPVFDGDGFGVGLTVAPRGPEPSDWPVPNGVEVRPTRLTELLPVGTRTPTGKAAELARVQRLKAQLAAYEAAVIVSFAADRPDSDDVPVGAPGAASPDWTPVDGGPAGISEFFVDELAAALSTSVTSASHTWTLLSTLHDRLPGTWRAMADGELDLPRGRAIAAEVARGSSSEPLVLLAV